MTALAFSPSGDKLLTLNQGLAVSQSAADPGYARYQFAAFLCRALRAVAWRKKLNVKMKLRPFAGRDGPGILPLGRQAPRP